MIVVILLVLCFLICPALADTGGEASRQETEKGKSWIHRTAETPLISDLLGSGTLSVAVVINEKRMPGLYITTPTIGLAKDMGLTRGSVLLTIDGYSVSSAPVLDAWLQKRPDTPLKYTYAVLEDGVPKIHGGEIAYKRQHPAFTELKPAAPTQNYSIDELENYGVTLINESRRAERKKELKVDPKLSRLARAYAEYMLAHSDQYGYPLRRNPHIDLEGRFPFQRAFAAGILMEVHENLGMETRTGLNDAQLVLKQHKMMMSEPEGQHNHRSILMADEADLVGVGVSRDQTQLYLVEEFGY